MEPIDDGYYVAPPDKLTQLTAAGDIAGVRAHFDAAFWEGRRERPTWEHVRSALLRDDKPMLRLLVTWNAVQPTDDEMVRLHALDSEKYPAHVRALRAAGMVPAKTPWEQLKQVKLKPAASPAYSRGYRRESFK